MSRTSTLDHTLSTDATAATSPIDIDTLIEPGLHAAVASLDGQAPVLAGMARYHLGWIDADGTPTSPETARAARGKRMRPVVSLLCCAAAGGDPARAAPLAAAIELLHNFTLVHDDIQDKSPNRRHRPTVWSIWGEGQAINAGDGLFAASHLALYRLRDLDVPADLTLRLSKAFDRMTIAIVEGQVLDLGFEGRADVTPDDYLAMIAGKTAAIVRYAAWAGALLAGANDATANRFGDFGLSLGLGFQVRDDLLGIWGAANVTGKAAADDIRRRKQSLPILLLRERANAAVQAELTALYSRSEIDESGIERVLNLLAANGVRDLVESRVATLHDRAREALFAAAPNHHNPARAHLLAMIDEMATRQS